MDLAALRTWLVPGPDRRRQPGDAAGLAQVGTAVHDRRAEGCPRGLGCRQGQGQGRARARRGGRARGSRRRSTTSPAARPAPRHASWPAAAGRGRGLRLSWRSARARRSRPSTARPGSQLALGALALGLALVPGWEPRAQRSCASVLILAAFALFPLAGILIAQGERGAGLLALGSVWLIVSGLAALLPRRLGWAGLVVAALPVLVGRLRPRTASAARRRPKRSSGCATGRHRSGASWTTGSASRSTRPTAGCC